MRTFKTWATRNSDKDKLDYSWFLSTIVIESYAKYMHKNRLQADGNMRDSDNWKQWIDKKAYMQSMFRHFMDVRTLHEHDMEERERYDGEVVNMEESLNWLLFNVMWYLYEHLLSDDERCDILDTQR